jgi:hypothetical protein
VRVALDQGESLRDTPPSSASGTFSRQREKGIIPTTLELGQSNNLPGLIKPSGSNAERTLRITAISAALRVLDR